ncbi:GNAT family N-acetyltransferase [Allohahella marinimesophila]|uniref:GNAT family N-acetyltransferase n=1 Tax=Allohahella marinimesophila TaxID=1054972 RepID=A0ABP7PRW1_9GAMM
MRALIVDDRFKRRYQDYLGQEYDLLLVSAWSGFSPNVLAALSATVRGGGLIILLTPAPAQWLTYDDPEYARLLAHPWTALDSPAYFLRYFIGALTASTGAPRRFESGAIEDMVDEFLGCIQADSPSAATTAISGPTDEQASVLANLEAASGRVDIISAERGRGKSTLLGYLAGSLAAAEPISGITALHPWQCSVALRQAAGSLNFRAPDEILQSGQRPALLFIDEAAALPLPMLLALIDCADQVVLASTSHGYEGSGQGFRLRLAGHLQARGREVHWHALEQPVRWDAQDPVEAFVARILLFQNTSGIQPPPSKAIGSPEVIDKTILADDPAALAAIMRLLMESHYQTSADDARVILDSPGIQLSGIFVADSSEPVAILMTDTEEPFEDALREAIWQGRRRPRGHLTQQVLAQQLGVEAALESTIVRIVRVAVASAYRRQGLASSLLAHLEAFEDKAEAGSALHAASFGNDPVSLAFWLSQGYTLVRQGQRQSGSHGGEALLVIKPMEESGEQLTRDALLARGRALATEPAEPASDSHCLWPQPALEPWERELIGLFCDGARPIEAVLPLLLIDRCQSSAELEAPWQSALRDLAGGGDWAAIGRLTGLSGKKAIVAGLRLAVARII